MSTITPWQVLASRYLLKKHWLNVREDRVRTGRGAIIDEFHVLEAPSWACVLCVSVDRELILIRQYRHGAREVTLELPAGVIEGDETPEAGARRELREETGYVAERWIELVNLNPEPSRHTHRAHCFVALEARPDHGQALDLVEQVEVVRVPVARTLDLVHSGQVDHAVHVAALLLARAMNLV
jgi:8-oxo-dGTP pyrophosphatase MutT (NUDIX family)